MFLIAEIGQAHEGSLGIAHSYIDALAETGVNAVKFQTHIADAESSENEPFRIKFSYEDQTRFDYWKRMEFTTDQWKGLKKHCEEKGLEFISSPFSNAAVDILESIGVKRYKIGSGEVLNFLMLDKIGRTGKPIILSSGMSSYDELDQSISFLKKFNNDITILQCTSKYPTSPEDWGLNVLQELKNKYHFPVGYSDHSGDIAACLAAATLGAEILEFHVAFDKRIFGPDAKSSLTIDQIKLLVKGVQDIYTALNNPINKNDNIQYKSIKQIFEKSLAINRDLKMGEQIEFDMLEAKKPKGYGIDAINYQKVIGKKIRKDMKQWQFINGSDIYD